MVPDTASRLPLIEKKNETGVCAACLQSSNHTNAGTKSINQQEKKKKKIPKHSSQTPLRPL